MNELLQNFVESLREELRHYGELLALLDSQQDQVVHRRTDDLLETVCALNAQGEAVQNARRERAQRQRELAGWYHLPGEVCIAELLPVLPGPYQLLVQALVDESNQLLVRVRQRARQNHILLKRSLELMEQFINSFCAASAPTYDETGSVAIVPAPRLQLYEGVG